MRLLLVLLVLLAGCGTASDREISDSDYPNCCDCLAQDQCIETAAATCLDSMNAGNGAPPIELTCYYQNCSDECWFIEPEEPLF